MFAVPPPSVSCAFGNGGSHAKLHNSQLQHHHCLCRAQAAVCSSFFGCEGGLLQHRQGSFLQAAKQFSCLCLTERFGLPGFEGHLQQQLTRVHAHSEQHLSLQEDQERLLRTQERREALKKYKTTILDSINQHQASLQQSALLSTNSQTEGATGGYVPEGFDVSSCCRVFVGNVHNKVSNTFLAEVFSTVGPLTACRVIRKAKSSYGFVEYQDHLAAEMAISTLNGRKLFKLPIRVNWAFPVGEWEDPTEYHTIFVGDLSIHVTDAVLLKAFSTYPSCSGARVVWDPQSGTCKGFGFVSFREREDAVKAIEEMTGKFIDDKAIRCDWAVSKETTVEEPPASKETTVEEPPENKAENVVQQLIKNNPRYTTVYVGNVAHKVSREELQEFFNGLGVGFVEDVQIARKKGYGFVRYSTQEEAALAIQAADGQIVGERSLKCGWGTKPNTLLGLSDSLSLASPADQSSKRAPTTPAVEPVEELTLIEG